jgi:formate dehydrogenase major subunit
MTNSFSCFSDAKLFMCIGTNMAEAHPVAATFLKNAVRKGAELIVVDPRRHILCDHANLFAQIKVGTDVAFLNGLMNVLLTEDLYDKRFVEENTEGFEELRAVVLKYPVEKSAAVSGVTADLMRQIARRMAAIKPAMVCYTLGITEHTSGRNNVVSIANLQMLLGNIGMEHGGVNPLRGQNNVQGACDMGALPNTFPGYQAVTIPAAQEKFAALWGVPKVSGNIGLMIPQMLDGLRDGTVKAFYCFGENPAKTEPNLSHVQRCLESAEFMIGQDIFPNETNRYAHVILPSAAWCEDDGTFTNSERRVSRVRKIKEPPGLAKPNWWIFREIARRMGHAWVSASAREIWDNEVSVSAAILNGIKYYRIENDGLQWPCPAEDHPGTPVLHRDGHFSRGKGLFVPAEWTPPAEIEDKDFPFVLSTGRRLHQYCAATQTSRSEGINTRFGEETADISEEDARRLGIADGERIKVFSRRGEVKVPARITREVPRGMVWMSFHFQEGNSNWLTIDAFDPVTLTAEYKACAVNIEKLGS